MRSAGPARQVIGSSRFHDYSPELSQSAAAVSRRGELHRPLLY